ncbi:hypothetical protein ACS0TY_036653 [Phlomoides rotata]
MSHSAVPEYICQRRRDLVRAWMRLLASVQGMNTQKRETGSRIEDDNDSVHLPFVLCHSMTNVLSLLVAGAFSVNVNDSTGEETLYSTYKQDQEDQGSLRHAKVGRLSQESSVCSISGKSALDHEAKAADSFPVPSSALWLVYECLRVLSLSDWPDITYDVSSQEISVHIPLHRLLSMVLRRALKECYGDSGLSHILSASIAESSFVRYGDFLCQILDGAHPCGFSAFLMEHPLRIRVFCAQVHAGMWRRNGDVPLLFSEWYCAVRWSEQGHELDLFLLQCCAALAPPDLYVMRILERFALSNYLSLNLEQSSEKGKERTGKERKGKERGR